MLNTLLKISNKITILVTLQIWFSHAIFADENSTQIKQLIIKLNNEGLSHSDASNYKEAFSSYNKALQLINGANLNDGLLEATLLSNLGHAYIYSPQPDLKKAVKTLKESIRIKSLKKNSIYKNINESIAFDYLQLGRVYADEEIKKSDLAISHFEKSLNYYSESPQINQQIYSVYEALTHIHQEEGNIEEAIHYGKLALETSYEKFGPKSRYTATALNNIAWIYYSLSSNERAAEYFEKALKIDEESEEADPLSYVQIYEYLADIYAWSTNDNNLFYDRAVRLLEKALAIRLALTSQPNEETATTYLYLAEAKIKQLTSTWLSKDISYKDFKSSHINKFRSANLDISKSLEILKKLYGPSHSKVAEAYNEASRIYMDLYWEHEESKKFLNKALEIFLNLHGPKHDSVAWIYNRLGVLENSYQEKINFHEKALKIMAEIKGPDHHELQVIYGNLGYAYSQLIEPDKSIFYYQKRHSILKEKLGIEDEKIGKSYDLLALHHNYMEQKELALSAARKGNHSRELYTEKAFNYFSQLDRLAFLNEHAPYDVYGTLGEAEDIARAILKWKGIVLDSIIRQRQEETKVNERNESLFIDNFDKIRNSLQNGQVLLEFIKYRHYHPYRKMKRSKSSPEYKLPKLQLISLPGVQFFESPLDEVMQELERQARKHDITETESAKKGIKMKLKGFENKPLPKVTVTLNSMPIGSMIEFISEMISTPYRIENGEIVLYPKNLSAFSSHKIPIGSLSQSNEIVTEKFELSKGELWSMIVSYFKDDPFANSLWLDGKVYSEQEKKEKKYYEDQIQSFLKRAGMNFGQKNLHSIKFNSDSRVLTIMHEKRHLDKFRWFLANNPLKTELYELTQSLIGRMLKTEEKKSNNRCKFIKIPPVKFIETPLDKAMAELQKLAKKHDTAEKDPARKGLNIIVLDYVTDPFAKGRRSKIKLPKITLSLDSMTVGEMIEEISNSVNWTYDIKTDAVVISHTHGYKPDNTGLRIKEFLGSKGVIFNDLKGHRFIFDGFQIIVTHDHQTIGYVNSLFDPFGDYEERYGVALITNKDNKILPHQWIDIGKSSSIDNEILELRKTNGKSSNALQVLYNQIFKKIAPKLPLKTTDLIISPDDSLCFLPFSCLLDENDKFLCESFRIINISSGRDLIAENSNGKESTKTFVGFGNPDFNKIEDTQLALLTEKTKNNEVLRSLSFASLPGSQSEIKKIEELVLNESFKAFSFTEGNASEKALRSMNSPYILHLATHGFFISQNESTKSSERFAFFNEETNSDSTNPMHYSGLLLSGARTSLESYNQKMSFDSKNDGILTAEEASQLDLSETWLTVLSACDTGSGVARAGEGVLGLRRAFAMAGTQNLLLTLWPVSDSFTKDFMVSFYEEALKTGNAPKALAKVQKEWLIKLREERSISQAVKLAGPFILTFRGNPELN